MIIDDTKTKNFHIDSKILVFFVLCFFINLIIFFQLNPYRTLWSDEISSYFYSTGILPIFSDIDPPLYYLLLNVWILLFGRAEIILRVLSFIFGFATGILVYLLSDFLAKDKVINIGATMLFLFNPLVNTQMNNARMYTLFVFLLTLTILMFLYYCKTKKSIYYIILVLTSILTLYTHFYGIFTLFGIGLIELYEYTIHSIDSSTFKMLLLKDFFIFVSFLPLLIFKILYVVDYARNTWGWIPPLTFDRLLYVVNAVFYNKYFFIFIILLIGSTFFFVKKHILSKVYPLLITTFLTTSSIPLIISIEKILVNSSIIMEYYWIFLTIPFAILGSFSFFKVLDFIQSKLILNRYKGLKNIHPILYIDCLLIISIFIPHQYYSISNPINTSYPKIHELIPLLLTDNTSTILTSPKGLMTCVYYLPTNVDSRLYTVPNTNITTQAFITKIHELVNISTKIWYIKYQYMSIVTENVTTILGYLNTIGIRLKYFSDNVGMLEAWEYQITNTTSSN